MSIATNGDILFMTGKHRLAIAKAVDENYLIPARVSHRHADWQKYRDKLFTDLKEGEIDKDYILKLNHPDLYDLIE